MPAVMQDYKGDGGSWNALIARLPGSHLLQTWEWARVKSTHGWRPMPVVWVPVSGDAEARAPLAAAMILRRSIGRTPVASRASILYVPKGPLLDWGDAPLSQTVLEDLERLARRQRAIFVKLDPDVIVGSGRLMDEATVDRPEAAKLISNLRFRGWRLSESQIQFKNTMVMDLTKGESQLLAAMKPKTRYNIRLASRKGVQVRLGSGEDLETMYRMYAETSQRDRFTIRNREYYIQLWETFLRNPAARDQPSATMLLAEVQGQAVAGLIVFFFARTAYYIYGMSRALHRDMMPNHLLQWEAIRHAKERGCERYDLWGAPDVQDEADSMWGVYRFKDGLGARLVRTLGAWDYAPNQLWYEAYTRVMPWILSVMRWRGKAQTRGDLQIA
jgi:peptidoglycan pentaglycine glycine transferase (the first glycine)